MRGNKLGWTCMAGVGALVLLVSASANADRVDGDRTDREAVQCPAALNAYVLEKTPAVKTACFDPFKDKPQTPYELKLEVVVRYNAQGQVLIAKTAPYTGPNEIGACVEQHVRSMILPCGPAMDTRIAFDFKKGNARTAREF